jgi:hypothetical protein
MFLAIERPIVKHNLQMTVLGLDLKSITNLHMVKVSGVRDHIPSLVNG